MPDREKVIAMLERYVRIPNLAGAENYGTKIVNMPAPLITDALALLKAQEPRVLSVSDIIDVGITPDIIWIERRKEDDVAAGVWQIDHYEMMGGGVVDDLGEEIAEAPEAYNTKWRCWTARPDEKRRAETPWE